MMTTIYVNSIPTEHRALSFIFQETGAASMGAGGAASEVTAAELAPAQAVLQPSAFLRPTMDGGAPR